MTSVHKAEIERHIHLFFERERAASPSDTMRQHLTVLEEFVLGPGKRLRPLFLVLFYEGCGKPVTDTVYDYAIAMEFLHCSTLVLDDIMDEDTHRRNAPTVINVCRFDLLVSRSPKRNDAGHISR